MTCELSRTWNFSLMFSTLSLSLSLNICSFYLKEGTAKIGSPFFCVKLN